MDGSRSLVEEVTGQSYILGRHVDTDRGGGAKDPGTKEPHDRLGSDPTLEELRVTVRTGRGGGIRRET